MRTLLHMQLSMGVSSPRVRASYPKVLMPYERHSFPSAITFTSECVRMVDGVLDSVRVVDPNNKAVSKTIRLLDPRSAPEGSHYFEDCEDPYSCKRPHMTRSESRGGG